MTGNIHESRHFLLNYVLLEQNEKNRKNYVWVGDPWAIFKAGMSQIRTKNGNCY